MNWEVLTQALDTAAFVLVTPEILGEGRLQSFQRYLGGPALLLKGLIGLAIMMIALVIFFVGILIVTSTTFSELVRHHILIFAISLIVIPGVGLAIFLLPMYLKTHMIPWTVHLTENLAVRGRLFLMGAACFLLARGISIGLAMHATVR